MTLAERVQYCRRQIAAHAMSDHDWPVWLAEHDGLCIGGGLVSEWDCRNAYLTDARLRLWFERGLEDGRVLRSLEDTTP